MGGKTDALVRVAFWLLLFLATGSVWVRDGRHAMQEREAALAQMKAAAAAKPQPEKVSAAAEATTIPASGASQAASTTTGGGEEAAEEEEFDSFEEPATSASGIGASDAAGKVHVQFCHG